jgi:hypothetical protein
MKTVTVHNPGTLLVVNGRSNMQRTANRRGSQHKPGGTTKPKSTAVVKYNAGAKRNPRAHRATAAAKRNPRRRRNPSAKGLFIGSLYAGAGGMAAGFVKGFIPTFGTGIIWETARDFAAAYIVSWGAERFVSPQNALYAGIGAFGGAAWNLVTNLFGGGGGLLSQFMPGSSAPAAPMGDITPRPIFLNGLGDIVPAPKFYPNSPRGY